MIHVRCEQCGQSLPMNDMFTVHGRSLCEPCGDQDLAGRSGSPEPGDVDRQLDPTVCHQCGADGGVRELPRIVGVPLCDACEDTVRRRPFPMWIKLAAAMLVCLAVVAFLYNLRFFQGFVELRQANRAMAAGDVAEAAAMMASAARHVPEERQLAEMAEFYSAIDLCRQDRAAEAIPVLQQCINRFPPGSSIHRMAGDALIHMEASAAFERKDYDTFLKKLTELLQREPGNAMALASVASAHACKFAVTGDEAQKRLAIDYLDQALKKDKGPEIMEYRQRILHRLHTREIIKKDEFDRRFPKGWNPETKS